MSHGRPFRARMRRGEWARWGLFSILGHIVLFLGAQAAGVRGCRPPADADAFERALRTTRRGGGKPVEVALIEPRPLDPFARSREAELEREAAKKAEEARKPEDDPNFEGQVVEVPKPNVEIRPEEARFVSEYDTKDERQTRAQGNPGVARPAPPRPAAAARSGCCASPACRPARAPSGSPAPGLPSARV